MRQHIHGDYGDLKVVIVEGPKHYLAEPVANHTSAGIHPADKVLWPTRTQTHCFGLKAATNTDTPEKSLSKSDT